MIKINYLTILASLLILSSCGKDKKLIESETTVLNFFKSVSESNEDSMRKYYPNIATFDSYFKSDSLSIKQSKLTKDTIALVTATNYFTNGFGKKTVKEIELYLFPDSLGAYSRITDSKGMTDHSENELYSFAIKTGCLKETDTTDVQKNNKFFEAYMLSFRLELEQKLDFITNVNVVDWSWKTGYSGSASGKGIVKNSTTFDIPKVKYEIKYKDRKGNVVTSDDGYVTYDKLRAGESQSFTFYTSYVGGATRASISVEYDDDMIKDYILQADYNGDEYDIYISEKNESELEQSL